MWGNLTDLLWIAKTKQTQDRVSVLQCFKAQKPLHLCREAKDPQNAHDALVVQGTLLVFLVPCSTHLWCAPDALGQALFLPRHGAAVGSPGPWYALGAVRNAL